MPMPAHAQIVLDVHPTNTAAAGAGALHPANRGIDRVVEGETRLYVRTPQGIIFETDYHACPTGRRLFTAVWLNVDGSGFLREGSGDQILAIHRA